MADVHGGPAFPVPLNPGQGWQGMAPCDGLTKREWFAGLALQGLLAQSCGVAMGSDPALGAAWACQMADAMLAALSIPSQGTEPKGN